MFFWWSGYNSRAAIASARTYENMLCIKKIFTNSAIYNQTMPETDFIKNNICNFKINLNSQLTTSISRMLQARIR